MAPKRKQTTKRAGGAWLTSGQAARHLDCSIDTIHELAESGELPSTRTAGGHRRFRRSDLDAYRARHQGSRSAGSRAGAAPKPVRAVPPPPDEDFVYDPELGETYRIEPEPPPPPPSPTNALRAGVQKLVDVPLPPAVDPAVARIASLKNFGLEQIPWGVPDSEKAKVVRALERYVTVANLPTWVSDTDARALVRAKVEETLKPYHAAVARREEEARDERCVQALTETGMSHARWETMDWDSEDRDAARREVERHLKDVIEADWSDGDVKDEVNAILDEWEEDDPEDE